MDLKMEKGLFYLALGLSLLKIKDQEGIYIKSSNNEYLIGEKEAQAAAYVYKSTLISRALTQHNVKIKGMPRVLEL